MDERYQSIWDRTQKQKKIEEVKKRLVFTTHTPEEAGNEKHDIYLCHKMSYFCGLSVDSEHQPFLYFFYFFLKFFIQIKCSG